MTTLRAFLIYYGWPGAKYFFISLAIDAMIFGGFGLMIWSL